MLMTQTKKAAGFPLLLCKTAAFDFDPLGIHPGCGGTICLVSDATGGYRYCQSCGGRGVELPAWFPAFDDITEVTR